MDEKQQDALIQRMNQFFAQHDAAFRGKGGVDQARAANDAAQAIKAQLLNAGVCLEWDNRGVFRRAGAM